MSVRNSSSNAARVTSDAWAGRAHNTEWVGGSARSLNRGLGEDPFNNATTRVTSIMAIRRDGITPKRTTLAEVAAPKSGVTRTNSGSGGDGDALLVHDREALREWGGDEEVEAAEGACDAETGTSDAMGGTDIDWVVAALGTEEPGWVDDGDCVDDANMVDEKVEVAEDEYVTLDGGVSEPDWDAD